jgi:hypothetical protein
MATISSGSASKAVCDRCRTKYVYTELREDGNSPGLKVCSSCWDSKDPYRFAPAQPDPITLTHPRPDTPIPSDLNYLLQSDDGTYLTTTDGSLIRLGNG